jgi:hypothetical protein
MIEEDVMFVECDRYEMGKADVFYTCFKLRLHVLAPVRTCRQFGVDEPSKSQLSM